ncbi:hypothetical protein RIF29_18492 [Crotalaria pallida]|uniref:Uncharacterized protein n=1 Tax=Crotalaria pallida TaxID=3830 RepID=A0AAN9FL99_CROPI
MVILFWLCEMALQNDDVVLGISTERQGHNTIVAFFSFLFFSFLFLSFPFLCVCVCVSFTSHRPHPHTHSLSLTHTTDLSFCFGVLNIFDGLELQ